MYQQEEKLQVRRRQAERAIQLAMASRWEEAVDVNKAIIELFPNDADSYNRLGKALMELARYNEAKRAYKKAVELDPTNQIAKKNLSKITALAKAGAGPTSASQVDPTLFIEPTGKSTVTTLRQVDKAALAKLDAGDRVQLHPEKQSLVVRTTDGEKIGVVEPKLGTRLIKLMQGGNQYAAAVTSVSESECRVIIKETYQDPRQAGRPSFPATISPEGMRPYTKERLFRYEEPQIEELEEAEETEEELGTTAEAVWEEEPELAEGDVPLADAVAAEDVLDEDELE